MLSQSNRKADQLSTTCHAKAVAKADPLFGATRLHFDLLVEHFAGKPVDRHMHLLSTTVRLRQ